jgi:hypothetical protein
LFNKPCPSEGTQYHHKNASKKQIVRTAIKEVMFLHGVQLFQLTMPSVITSEEEVHSEAQNISLESGRACGPVIHSFPIFSGTAAALMASCNFSHLSSGSGRLQTAGNVKFHSIS